MNKILLKTPICDHEHAIITTDDDDKVHLKVETSCNIIKNILEDELEVSKDEAMLLPEESGIRKLINELENEHPQCFLPPAIVTGCFIASGRLSEGLAKKSENTEMIIE